MRGELKSSHSRRRADVSMAGPRLVLLLKGDKLHAGVSDNNILGRRMCDDGQSFTHPLFTRDPNFGVGVPASERHLYALAAFRLNPENACGQCLAQMIEAHGDGIYPYLDPYVPQPGEAIGAGF